MTRIGVALVLGALAACQVSAPGEEVTEQGLETCENEAFPYGTWDGKPAPLGAGSMQVVVQAGNGYLAAVVDTQQKVITWGVKLTSQDVPYYMKVNAFGPIIGPGPGPLPPCWNSGISGDCDVAIKAAAVFTARAFESAADAAAFAK